VNILAFKNASQYKIFTYKWPLIVNPIEAV